MTDLVHIEIDDADLPASAPEVEQERRVAIFDLLEDNAFALVDGASGPHHLLLAIREGRIVFDVSTPAGAEVAAFHLSLGPLRQVVKDYRQICASYFDAVKTMPPSQIETIDMARRGIHQEGARILQERLEGKVETDAETARRLFTLICVLQAEG